MSNDIFQGVFQNNTSIIFSNLAGFFKKNMPFLVPQLIIKRLYSTRAWGHTFFEQNAQRCRVLVVYKSYRCPPPLLPHRIKPVISIVFLALFFIFQCPFSAKAGDKNSCLVAVELAAGGYHTCARTSGGAVYCWGYNGYGKLGIGSTILRPGTPQNVKNTDGTGTGFLSGVKGACSGGTTTPARSPPQTPGVPSTAGGRIDEGQLGIRLHKLEALASPKQVKGVGGNGFLSVVSGACSGGRAHLRQLTSTDAGVRGLLLGAQ